MENSTANALVAHLLFSVVTSPSGRIEGGFFYVIAVLKIISRETILMARWG